MTQLDSQFYDQLAKRLDRQDSALDRIEVNQVIARELLSKQAEAHDAHTTSDLSNLKWIKWALGGIWGAIGAIVLFLLKH
jgi:hypothetical protein